MALSNREVRDIAGELILFHNDEFEYDLVSEDDRANDWSETDKRAIYSAMYDARIVIMWPDE